VGKGIKYIRVPVKASTIQDVMVLKGRTTPVSQYIPTGYRIENLTAEVGDNQIEYPYLHPSIRPHRFYGAKVNTLGDSLTAPGQWQAELKAMMGFSVIRNYGVGGTTVTSARQEGMSTFRDRAPAMDDDADLIIVFTSINDNGTALGTDSSTDVATVGGAGNVLAGILRAKYPYATIIFTSNPHTHWPWSYGAADMYRSVCGKYGMPFLDLLRTSNIDGLNSAANNYFFTDGVHMTVAGHKRLAETMAGLLRSL
jgi:lysophospholipase L1-like esterase